MSVVKLTKKQWIIVGSTILLLIATTIAYAIYHNTQRSQSIARVNGQYISLEAYENRKNFRIAFLEAQEQNFNEATVAADTFERTIDDALIAQYAQQQGFAIEEAAIDTRIQRTREQLGEEEFNRRLTELYGDDTSPYREVIRADLLREKVVRDLGDTSLALWLSQQRSEAQIEQYGL